MLEDRYYHLYEENRALKNQIEKLQMTHKVVN